MTRYERQNLILGSNSIEILSTAKIAIIGAGALGSVCTEILVRMGIGEILVIDHDLINISNLSRQFSYTTSDINKNKAVTLAYKLNKIGLSKPQVFANPIKLTTNNINILEPYSLIIDCSDNFDCKYMLCDYSNEYNKILISAAVDGFMGQVMVFYTDSCYRCVFPDINNSKSCQANGAIASATATIAAFQANCIIKEILMPRNASYMLHINLDTNTSKEYTISTDLECINQHTPHQKQNDLYIDYSILDESWDLIESNKLEIDLFEKNQKICVYCKNGIHSKITAGYLNKIGFTQAKYTLIPD